jgi:hypothetical protein
MIQKEERKVVVKDNNWVNAAAVPSKMKSNIISYNNEEFEEEAEDDLDDEDDVL